MIAVEGESLRVLAERFFVWAPSDVGERDERSLPGICQVQRLSVRQDSDYASSGETSAWRKSCVIVSVE